MKAGKRWLATLVLPYLVFQAAYLFVDAKVTHGAFIYRVAQPYWVMWYLLSLASWRLLLPAVLAVRWPIAVTGVAALLVGLLPDVGYGFSLSWRTGVRPTMGNCGGIRGSARDRLSFPHLFASVGLRFGRIRGAQGLRSTGHGDQGRSADHRWNRLLGRHAAGTRA
jgi:hypothetical protein